MQATKQHSRHCNCNCIHGHMLGGALVVENTGSLVAVSHMWRTGVGAWVSVSPPGQAARPVLPLYRPCRFRQ